MKDELQHIPSNSVVTVGVEQQFTSADADFYEHGVQAPVEY